jgi:hypothetical protein
MRGCGRLKLGERHDPHLRPYMNLVPKHAATTATLIHALVA